jgi:hypothetical protein
MNAEQEGIRLEPARTLVQVRRRDIIPSSVLPPRHHSKEIRESVKQHGTIQFPIVRPSVMHPGKYECLDGHGRLETYGPDDYLIVDLRENVSDAAVFKTSEATHKRDQRSAYENATFYNAYVNTVRDETGEEGALSRVAKESQISPSQLSQYMAINDLFTKLAALKPEAEFRNLKSMGINSLYTLSKIADHPDLPEIALQIEQDTEGMSTETINAIVDNKLNEATPDVVKDIEAAVSADTPPGPADNTVFDAKSKVLSEKLNDMITKLNTILPQIRTETTPLKVSSSPETLKLMERTSVTLRRLLYYLRKLKKVQRQTGTTSDKTGVDAQTSETKESDTIQNATQ